MNEKAISTIGQVRQFMEGTADVEFLIGTKAKWHEWIEETLIRFRYLELCRPEKGLLLRDLSKVSGYSHIQVKRFVRQYFETGCSAPEGEQTWVYKEIHGRGHSASGPNRRVARHAFGAATKKLCERACGIFGECAYRRLAQISVAHLYNHQ